jgi:hypothetical protein
LQFPRKVGPFLYEILTPLFVDIVFSAGVGDGRLSRNLFAPRRDGVEWPDDDIH